MLKKIVQLQIVLLLLNACATVPLTGRQQLSLVSNPEIISMATQQYQQVVKENKLSDNREQTEMVKRVGGRIKGAVEQYMADAGISSQLEGFNWEFNLIQDDKTANA
jgi:hypothetical protein